MIGVADVEPPWGYQIGIEDGDWDAVYTLDGGDADAGTLAFEVGDGAVNIPAPDGGLYFFDVSLKALTYNSKALGSDIYIAGLNKLKDEDWTFEPLPAASAIGVFSGSITITQPSAWGFKIYLLTETGITFMAEVPGNFIIRVLMALRMTPRWHRAHTP